MHEGGGTTQTVNQRTNFGQWNTLAAGKILDPVAGHKLDLPGNATGPYVNGDAARFVPSANLPLNVTWKFTPHPPARIWSMPNGPPRAAHDGGQVHHRPCRRSTGVTVNQRIMGGQLVLLGSYTMNASAAYTITLSDNPKRQMLTTKCLSVTFLEFTETTNANVRQRPKGA